MRKGEYVDTVRNAVYTAASSVSHSDLPDEPLYQTVAWKGGFALISHDGGERGEQATAALQALAEQVGSGVTAPHPSYH